LGFFGKETLAEEFFKLPFKNFVFADPVILAINKTTNLLFSFHGD